MTPTDYGAWRPGLTRNELRAGLAIVALELLSVTAYFALSGDSPATVRYVLYPFVWINAGLWAVHRTDPTPGSRSHRWLAAGVGVAYFLVVMAVPGNLGPGGGLAGSLRVAWESPGWGPIVAYAGVVRLYLVPFEVVGYASLAYLVFANALDLTRGTLGGAFGLVTCVGCTVPVVAPVVGLLGGPATSLATTAYAWSYDLGTAVFVATLGVLYASHRRTHG